MSRATLAQAVFEIAESYQAYVPSATVPVVVRQVREHGLVSWNDALPLVAQLAAVQTANPEHLDAAVALVELTLALGWDSPDEAHDREVSGTTADDWALHSEAYGAAKRWFGASDEARRQVVAFLAY